MENVFTDDGVNATEGPTYEDTSIIDCEQRFHTSALIGLVFGFLLVGGAVLSTLVWALCRSSRRQTMKRNMEYLAPAAWNHVELSKDAVMLQEDDLHFEGASSDEATEPDHS